MMFRHHIQWCYLAKIKNSLLFQIENVTEIQTLVELETSFTNL